jgi:hypothetical protein
MSGPASRVSRVLLTGPLAPVRGGVCRGPEGAWLYAVGDGQRASAGGAVEPVAAGGRAVGG